MSTTLSAQDVGDVEDVVRRALDDLLDGGTPPFLSPPIPVWAASRDLVASDGLQAAARHHQWAIFVGGTDFGVAKARRHASGFKFSAFSPSGHSRAAWTALDKARRLSSGAEIRLLEIPGITVATAWAHGGAGEDVFVPYLWSDANVAPEAVTRFAEKVAEMARRSAA